MVTTLTLPLPPRYAKPNKRPISKRGLIILAREIKRYRAEVAAIARPYAKWYKRDKRIRVYVTLYKKGRKMDKDNAVGWCKSLFDGLQDGIGVNDRYFDWEVEQRCDRNNPRAIVTIDRCA